MQMMIETERLILRTMRLHDVSQEYADWLNDPEVNRHLSCAGKYQTIESCSDYVRSYERRDDRALIGVFSKENGLHIGNLTFSTIDRKNKSITIGICIGRRDYIGKGYGKEALNAIVKYCFNQLKLNRLEAYLSVDNVRSLNFFTGCGFKIEKRLKDRGIVNGRTQDDYLVSILRKTFLK